MTDTRYTKAIKTISVKELGREPDSIERVTRGICNEIYAVRVGDREYVFRLNQEPRFMLGSREHIPLFRSLGIIVPEILAEDYSLAELPFAFQMQKRIPGRDLGDVIESLTENELLGVAGEVANVFRRLSSVPNNGHFGVAFADNRDLVPSWSAEVARVTEVVRAWGSQTGVLDPQLSEILDELNRDYRSYFDRIRPYTYFGDIAGKNVMVHEGRFSGLVDLDGLSQGDPLEAIGRIKSSWQGTRHGEVYTRAVMDALGLPEPQRRLVTMYALLNKVFWTLENGVKFNANTSRTVDRVRERSDKAIVEALYAELKGGPAREAASPFDAEPVTPVAVTPERHVEPTAIVFAPDPEVPISVPTIEEQVPHSDRTEAAEVISEYEKPLVSVPEYTIEHLGEDTAPPAEETQSNVEEEPVRFISPVVDEVEPQPAPEPVAEVIHPSPEREMQASLQIENDSLEPTPPLPVFTPPAVEESRRVSIPRNDGRAMLEASGLSKTYASDGVAFNALRSVDLKISRGDCLAIVGKSGSGKSTLMHLLACLDGPSEGYVYVDGEDTTTMSEAEKNRLRNEKFGFVFQQFFLNGRDSVFENIVLPMRIRGAADFDITTAADEALAAVGLTDKAQKRAKDLSGGEKQRVCIARALVGSPEVIFADEPTGNLDSNTGEAIEKLLFDLNRSKGITLIVVTHDPELANRFDRIVEMKDGRIVNEYGGTSVGKLAAGRQRSLADTETQITLDR